MYEWNYHKYHLWSYPVGRISDRYKLTSLTLNQNNNKRQLNMWLLLYFLKKIVVKKVNFNKEHFKEQIDEMMNWKESDLLDHWTESYVCRSLSAGTRSWKFVY